MIYAHRCLIVPAAYAPLVRALCEGMAEGDAGSNMFITGLSATGDLPATHFISNGKIAADFASLLPLTTFDDAGKATTQAGQSAVIVQLANKAGEAVTLVQINAMLAAVDVTEQEPFAALERLGLQLVLLDAALSCLSPENPP